MASVEIERKGGKAKKAGANVSASRQGRRLASDTELKRWLAKYEPVERAIMEERARRFEAAEKRRVRRRIALGTLCETTEGLAKIWNKYKPVASAKRRGRAVTRLRGKAGAAVLPLARIGKTNLHVLDGGIVSVLLSIVGVECTRDLDAMRHSLKRPLYYERENARRRALAAERRKVRRRGTINPCPTREEVLDAWVNVKKSREDMLRFGGMMEDLECYVDNSLRFGRDGAIVGREAGLKGWLQMNIPALYGKYKTIMRYKAAAKKLRQVVELKDPSPVSLILRAPDTGGAGGVESRVAIAAGMGKGVTENEITRRTKSLRAGQWHEIGNTSVDVDGSGSVGGGKMDLSGGVGLCRTVDSGGTVESGSLAVGETGLVALRARAVYLEAMEGVPDNATRTIERLDELLDPERVEDATMLRDWKERYENEITMRTKSRWFKRLFGTRRKEREKMRECS